MAICGFTCAACLEAGEGLEPPTRLRMASRTAIQIEPRSQARTRGSGLRPGDRIHFAETRILLREVGQFPGSQAGSGWPALGGPPLGPGSLCANIVCPAASMASANIFFEEPYIQSNSLL